jgi:superfamily I DNA and/or RNA helicase
VPWSQKKEFARGEMNGLFASQVEANGVVEILDQFEPVIGKECEIQILSPYADQLKEIKRAIKAARKKGDLEPMFLEPFDLTHEKRIGATVDEFQGSEADIVVVSLVRNNALVPWRSVGFLKESNRMNVLLSRARQKLVIVGSWDFFRSRCDKYTTPDAEYAYLGKLMSLMSELQSTGKLQKVSLAK